MSRSAVRTVALVAAALWAISFFLPAAQSIPGYEAFWLSLGSWGEIASWEASSLPLIFAWIANVGAIGSLLVVFSNGPGRTSTRILAALGGLALGPMLVSRQDLRIGFYLWAGALLVLAALALLSPPKPST